MNNILDDNPIVVCDRVHVDQAEHCRPDLQRQRSSERAATPGHQLARDQRWHDAERGSRPAGCAMIFVS
jgi:hypothetical protein